MLSNSKDSLLNILKAPDILSIVINSMSETISQYTQTSIKAQKVTLIEKLQKDNIIRPCILGLINFKSEKINVDLLFGIDFNLYKLLYENMFNSEISSEQEIDQESADLTAEILNISFGKIDPELKKKNITMKSSLPIAYHDPFKIDELMKNIVGNDFLIIPFETTDKQKKFSIYLFSSPAINEKWVYSA